MPSRKLCDHCPRCNEKNHLRARFCNQCGSRLDETRGLRQQHHPNSRMSPGRMKLHADIAHPINAGCRSAIENEVVEAFYAELERSKQPGYVPPNLDHEDFDFDDRPAATAAAAAAASSHLRLRPTGTMAH